MRIFAVCFALVLAQAGLAQGTQVAFGQAPQDPSEPVEATSDELFIEEETGSAVFTGNVVIIQGDMRMSAEEVKVNYAQERKEIEQMLATGGVLIVSGEDAAEAQRADYNFADRTIVMTGDVLMTQGPQVLSGEKLTIYLDDGTARMSGRVRTVLQDNN